MSCHHLQASSSASDQDSHAGHAFLHDFCMSLPYGALAIIAAIVLVALGARQAAAHVGVGGLIVTGSAVLSLKAWRSDKPTAALTMLSGGECQSVIRFFAPFL